MGHSRWGHEESDTTERLNTKFPLRVAPSYLPPWRDISRLRSAPLLLASMGLANGGHRRGLEGGRGHRLPDPSTLQQEWKPTSRESHTLGLSLLSCSSQDLQIPQGPGNTASALVCLVLEEPESSCFWQSFLQAPYTLMSYHVIQVSPLSRSCAFCFLLRPQLLLPGRDQELEP